MWARFFMWETTFPIPTNLTLFYVLLAVGTIVKARILRPMAMMKWVKLSPSSKCTSPNP